MQSTKIRNLLDRGFFLEQTFKSLKKLKAEEEFCLNLKKKMISN